MKYHLKTLEFDTIIERMVSFAKSQQAVLMLKQLKPISELSKIQLLLDEVLEVKSMIDFNQSMPLIENFDIIELIELIEKNGQLGIEGILQFRLLFSMEKDCMNYLYEIKKQDITFKYINHYLELTNHHALYQTFYDLIDAQGNIYDHATPKLQEVRKALLKAHKRLEEHMQKALKQFDTYLSERIIVTRNNRDCLAVKESFKHKVKGVIHDVSQSGQTFYIEPEVSVLIHQEISHLMVLEKQEIDEIIRSLNHLLLKHIHTIKTNVLKLIKIDFIQAKALYSIQTHAIKPKINKQGLVHLKKARHPLLDTKTVVPIDISLSKEQHTILITGPNTGGKTVALKTLGLLTLMMQSGILILAEEGSELAVFEQVYADIGDEQSISQSLSTFSSHMTKIIDMIKLYSDHTLILLDEIGSGTDPSEGVALAMAILNKFHKKDVRIVVTTHYSELKSYAYEKEGIVTASVKFDVQTLKPLYELKMHTMGASHALLITKRLGMPETVLEEAQQIFSNRQNDLSKIMEKLTVEKSQLEIEYQKNIQLEKTLSEAIASFEQKKKELMINQEKVIEEIKKKEEAKWQVIQDEAKKMIEQLKKSQNNHDVATLKHLLKKEVEVSETTLETFSVLDEVFIKSYQQYGKITAIKQDKYTVDMGGFKLNFKASDLTKVAIEPKKKKNHNMPKPTRFTGSTPKREGKLDVDLRGFRYEEVAYELDKAIDQALLANLSELRIIHGFGTFAVKNAVYEYLNKSKYIKSMRFGGEGEGLNGVTIIQLK